jgi:hypothetical protein
MLFTNHKNFYILASLDKDNTIGFKQRRKLLSGQTQYIPHLTLLTLIINKDNKHSKIFDSQSFKNYVIESFNKILAQVTLQKDDYKIIGNTRYFFVKTYKTHDTKMMTIFRTLIYEKIKKMLHIQNFTIRKSGKYIYFNSLFAVPIYDYKTKWYPHVVIVTNTDTSNNNIRKYILNNDVKSLTNNFKHDRVNPLPDIDISNCTLVFK